jgi:hypothetical protein
MERRFLALSMAASLWSCAGPCPLRQPATVAGPGMPKGAANGICDVAVANIEELTYAHRQGGLHLPVYWTTDAVWATPYRILVGSEFDFAIAAALDIGAGIAAAKRKKQNQDGAKQIAALADLEPAWYFPEASSQYDLCRVLAGRSVRLYVVLFGDTNAHVQVVLDLPENDGKTPRGRPMQFVSVSEARPLRGTDSWFADNGAFLRRATGAGVMTVASLVSDARRLEAAIDSVRETKGKAEVKCGIGGREAWAGLAFSLAEPTADVAPSHLLYDAQSATLVTCAETLTSIGPTAR